MAKKPADLTREQLIECVAEIVETLYPAADPDAQWEVDTIEWVSASLARFDLIPDECFPDEDEDEETQAAARAESAAFTAHVLDVAKAAHAAADAARASGPDEDEDEDEDGDVCDGSEFSVNALDAILDRQLADEDEDGEICDECGATIPDTADSVINAHHERSCSCHPDNVV
jgi:hypothetical protein